jgi:hypothetical protein
MIGPEPFTVLPPDFSTDQMLAQLDQFFNMARKCQQTGGRVLPQKAKPARLPQKARLPWHWEENEGNQLSKNLA